MRVEIGFYSLTASCKHPRSLHSLAQINETLADFSFGV
jgi:hypothetical protein